MEIEFDTLPVEKKVLALNLFCGLLQNEQQKAAQAMHAFNCGMAFGGTSISALVRVPSFDSQVEPRSFDELADLIARKYVEELRAVQGSLGRAFIDREVKLFEEHGLFYGAHISPKLIGLTEGLLVEHRDLLLPGFPDPYQLPNAPKTVIEAYFRDLKSQRGLDLKLSSLVLADTTTPKGYEGKKILNPVNLNEKLSRLSSLATQAIRNRGERCDELYLLCTDTDSPQRILLAEGRRVLEGYPLTPGLTMCGSTASMNGFDFKYAYRLGLIAQGLTNNIVSSKFNGCYSPFVFFGMLSPFGYVNGAIPTGKMGEIRYPGDIDLRKEFLFQFDNHIKKLIG